MFHVEQVRALTDLLIKGASDFDIPITSQNVSDLLVYLHELRIWNQKINLTAIRQDEKIVIKHFLDSLACSKALKKDPDRSSSLLDIGSGAGFPGLPLKIIHSDLELALLEPTQKKSAFLLHIIGTLGLKQATVLSRRIQDLVSDPTYQGRFLNVVTRALDIVPILSFIRPLIRRQGRLILCRAKPLTLSPELHGFGVMQQIAYQLPHGHGDRVLAVLEPALKA
jgi:16S rRNA (guanine527-N7)-methyltransferase